MFNNPTFEEARTQSANLPEDDPLAFELFVAWIYIGSVNLPDDPNDTLQGLVLVLLYSFAEKYNIVNLADHAMDIMVKKMKKHNWLPHHQIITLGYERTCEHSKLRLFLSKCFVYVTLQWPEVVIGGEWTNEKMDLAMKATDDFRRDVYALLRGQSGVKVTDPRCAALCEYHRHGPNEDCPNSPGN